MSEFSTKLFFLKEQKERVELRLRMFGIEFESEQVSSRFSPPVMILARVSRSIELLLCYRLMASPPLIPELVQCIERKALSNRLETTCLNLHEDGLKFGLAASAVDFEGEWRDFVTPEGTFMKLEHLFGPRTTFLPHFPEFGVFVRSWNTWEKNGQAPED